MAIDPKILAELVARLAGAKTRAEASRLIDGHARLCGLSAAQVRRHCKKAGVAFGYSRRRDSGLHHSGEVEAAASAVIDVIVQSHGAMPTWRAIEVARSQGLIDAALDIKPHFVDREIRDHAIARKPSSQPAVTRKIKWGSPGEVLQIDSTNCQQWFFVDDDGRVKSVEPGTVYHNKPSKRTPIIRYVATDPSSGLFRVRYYQTDGESAQVTLDFLFWAMQRDDHPEFMPLAGVPKALVLDNGSGNRSAAMVNVCHELGIDHRCHLPHHAWAKGGVEKSMDVWQSAFESELRAWPARDIGDMNARATASLYKFSTTRIHTRHSMTRSAFYAKFASPDGLVMPPPYERFLEAATTARVERTVGGDLLISFDGRDYYAGELPGVSRGDKVLVAKCVLDWNETEFPVRLYAGDEVRVEKALARDGQGNYSDQRLYVKRTDAVLEARDARQALRMAAPMPQTPPEVVQADLPRVQVPRARLRLAPPAPAQPTRRNVQARMELARQLGRELNEFEVNGLGWGDAVTLQQIQNAVAALSQQRVLKVGPESHRAAIGG